MAAKDYYRDSSRDRHQNPFRDPSPNPQSSHIASQASQSSTNFYSQYNQSSQHLNTHSPAQMFKNSQPSQSPFDDRYADNIPLKNTSHIATQSTGWNNQQTTYPPSPESQAQKLLPVVPAQEKKGWFKGKIPWVVYIVTIAQISVFIFEIVKNALLTGSPIMIHPQFNPMIGPSTYVQIYMGARFVPCMRTTPGVQDAQIPINWPCPNTTSADSSDPRNHCNLSDLCGFSGFDEQHPNQWFRFIVPMFLHAGLIHISFNMLLQLTMGREMERAIGSIRFALIYFSSGIFGFVLGGNFAGTAVASTGASGCLFGVLALVLLDLIYHWRERRNPVRELMWIMFDILISFVLGLLPGLDNFAHIGGFLMGLASGICMLHSPAILRQRIGESTPPGPYHNIDSSNDLSHSIHNVTATVTETAHVSAFAKQPVGFFKNRKPLWWAWWLLRAFALLGVLVGFIVLLNNFYKYRDTCSWCKYLSCIPVNGWCDLGNLQFTNTTTRKRDVLLSSAVFVGDLWERAGMR